jgi:hypothetical protein
MSASKTDDTWHPATLDTVKRILKEQLDICSPAEALAFRRYAVEPFEACLIRYGKKEVAVIVARKQQVALYWEDVEEGFNISPMSSEGMILEHYCNQDTLGEAIRAWL